jgi:replicative DNA helicase
MAERAILGSVLLDPTMADVATNAGLRADSFYRYGHGGIWRAILRVRAGGGDPDYVTLRASLEASGELDDAGGVVYLASLVDGVPRSLNVESYVRIVTAKARLRAIISSARQSIEEAYSGDDPDDVQARAEARVLAQGHESILRSDFVLAADWISDVWSAVDEATTNPRLVTGVPSGIATVDRLTRGWQPANVIVIGGRAGQGKSALMMQMVDAASQHVFTGLVSLEMAKRELGFRWVAQESRVDAYRLMTGQLPPHEMRRVGEALTRLAERRVAIDDAGGQSVAGLCSKIRRLAHRYGLGIVFVDYLQLIQGSAENRTQEVSRISGGLVSLAKELNIPIVVLSQLSREAAKQGALARPQLHHLRDSGSIEQDAHVVVLIHRPNQQSESGRFTDGEEAELIVAKNRNGPANRIVPVYWDGPTMRFTDIQTRSQS